jgi:membrane-bound lytic murein transglycosylase D
MRLRHILVVVCCCMMTNAFAQQVDFCGEMVPMQKDFVSYRLMDVIKGHLRHRNFLPVLKAKTDIYFPMIVPILQQYNIPEDFKYLPVVESGFTNATSYVGAQGVWQLMPATAAALGLDVSYDNDERNHLLKATHAACRYLVQLHSQLHSWTLAAAAYNCGAGNISRNIKRQGSNDYYQLVLNNETAQYIYKIIAIKELFESPELYIPGFGFNVFNKTSSNTSVFSAGNTAGEFKTIRIDVGKRVNNTGIAYAARLQSSTVFKDGQLITVQLLDNLQSNGVYISKNTKLSGRAWLVSNRIYVDLGFGNTIILCDEGGRKGIPPDVLKSGGDVRLKQI